MVMYKQHIILDFEMNPVAGNTKEDSRRINREIIEIGAVRLDENYKKTDSFSCLVRPEYRKDVTRYITKLTGIKTADVFQAVPFAEAVSMFCDWIGKEKARIYSWSSSDLVQLKKECEIKGVDFPDCMKRWMDFQLVFPRLLGIQDGKKRFSLKDAAARYGIIFDFRHAHRAMYDAEITTELVAAVLTGEYRTLRDYYRQNACGEQQEKTASGYNMGEVFGDCFRQLIAQLQPETAL